MAKHRPGLAAALTFFLVFLAIRTVPAAPAKIASPVTTDFGTYYPVAVEVKPSVGEITVAPDLSNVSYIGNFKDSLTGLELEILQKNHFVSRPSRYKQIFDLYKQAKEQDLPVFVTTDAMLHTFHIIYDYSLRILETERFCGDLKALNSAFLQALTLRRSTDPLLEEELRRCQAFVNLAGVLADPLGASVLPAAGDLVAAELVLIDDHKGPAFSPILGYLEDYSQYVPRGHYTRSTALKNYFRAMMWYGRLGFRLRPGEKPEEILKGRSETRMALNLVSVLAGLNVGGEPALEVWERIYRPTVFFVGDADDLTVYDYAELARRVYGDEVQNLTPERIADSLMLTGFIEQARAMRKPRINSSLLFDSQDAEEATQGFRVMGQRFIPDSYVMGRLVHPYVYNRLFPRGLDVMAALGSAEAGKLLDEVYRETSYPGYSAALDSLKAELGSTTAETWASNLYWNWLYCLLPMLQERGAGYPRFMQGRPWTLKSLYSSLASWAELRHDTILYAKQSYTFETSIPVPGAVTRGYVEPAPEVFARLAALARYMRSSLAARNILPESIDWRLLDFESLQLALKTIAEKHLKSNPLSDAEYELIQSIGDRLETLVTFSPLATFAPEDGSQSLENDTDDEMAVIADVHTDPNSAQVLEEGVGYPLELFVIVPDPEGPRLALGGMFSYYEFKQPMNDRLTDEAWQVMLHTDQQPPQESWTGEFMDLKGQVKYLEHTRFLGPPVPSQQYRLKIPPEVVESGNTVEVWVENLFESDFSVRFWVESAGGAVLLAETALAPDPGNPGRYSAEVSTAGWPGAVVRAELVAGGQVKQISYLEIVTGASFSADLDRNGRVDLQDLIRMLELLVKGQAPDLNQDGKSDIFDLLHLLKAIKGR